VQIFKFSWFRSAWSLAAPSPFLRSQKTWLRHC